MQSITVAIIQEGKEGTLTTEIRKVIWENGIQFEKDFQPWWYLVSFTYDCTSGKATAFPLTACSASVSTIHQMVALGLNHLGTKSIRTQSMGLTKWEQIADCRC